MSASSTEDPFTMVVREVTAYWRAKWDPEGKLTDEQVQEIGVAWNSGGQRLHS